MCYFIIRLKSVIGSYYLCRCSRGEYNALVNATLGHSEEITIVSSKLSSNGIWEEIEATESLREQDYMIITYSELVGLLKEVFNLEV